VSKYQFRQSDIYLPGTDVPANRLNVTEPELLQAIEAKLLAQAFDGFSAALRPDTRFDEAYFLALHRCTFEDLYEWAGRYRSEDMVKGGSMFCRAAYLAKESRRIFDQLAQAHFLADAAATSRELFAERLAFFQGELIALHPFYELNGRVTRLFFDLLAIQNGHKPIDYSLAWQDDAEVGNNYIRASIDCVQRADHRLLTQLILAGLNPLQDDEA
jgi:cell filamentation protein